MLKYWNTGIVFQEIPDEVTLSVNITGCPCRCPGCHSHYLWEDTGTPLTPQALDALIGDYADEITCVSLMGGDADPLAVNDLARYLHHAHTRYRVAWYSGRSRLPSGVNPEDFDYIKLGPYLRHLGGLKERTTNQRLYKRVAPGEFVDITHRFWRQLID